MKLVFISIITVVLATSCSQSSHQTNASNPATVDSLVANWNNGWNKHDSAAVRNLFLADAVLIDDNLVSTNVEEISDKWVHPNIRVVNNLKTTKLQSWLTNDRAGYTGKYELDVIINDSVVAKPKGVFTLNWNKTTAGDWKLSTAHIHSFTEKK